MPFVERRVRFLDELEPEIPLYHLCEAVRLVGPLDVKALEDRFNPDQILWETHDLRAVGETERDTVAASRATEEACRPFDSQNGPLVRAVLLRLADEDHVLVLKTHPSICEGGWLMGVLLQKLQTSYNGRTAGERADLPETSVGSGDFGVRTENWLPGDELQEHLEFWKRQLAQVPSRIELPTDHPRSTAPTYRAARRSIPLSLELKAGLAALGREENATLSMTLLAAFQTLLFRYCGQTHLATGISVVDPSGPGGFFSNTLALAADFSGDPSFRQFLKQSRQRALDALSHADLPLAVLEKELQPQDPPAPLFQTMFVFQNVPRRELDFAGLAVSKVDLEFRTSMFEMTLLAWDKPDGLLATLEYRTDLFDAATIERMLRQLQTLIEGIVRHPSVAVSALPLLPEDEKQQLLVGWNDTARDYAREDTIHSLLERQAAATPHMPAVTFGQESLTYRELNARADRLANYLRARGVGKGTPVGILVERSSQMVVGLLGILKAGGAYVPLDPIYPLDLVSFMLEDSGAPVLLTEQSLPPIPGYGGTVVLLDSEWASICRAELCGASSDCDAGSRAYVIYTSGSTGKPKGVEISHRSVINLLESVRATIGFEGRDVLLAVTTLCFDIAGLEIWMPLLCGARVVVASREVAIDGAELARELARSRATHLQATPSAWRLLLGSGWTGNPRITALCGGESLPAELAHRLLDKVKVLWNVYGPTETTIWSSAHRVQAGDLPIPIGRPLANTQFYVLDERQQLAQTGVAGELYIGGDGVAAGYLNRPKLTAEKFVPNPFDPSGRSRLYRTGDRVRYRADGSVLFLGRLDHQVKFHGFRIELGEIGEALHRHAAVKEAVVLLDETGGEQFLVAYVATQAGGARTDDLKSFLRVALPEYMVPARFVFLEALPRTPNGKVDRRALPETDHSPNPHDRQFVEARTDLEFALKQIWQRLLDVRPIGVTDNYFDLGGHSLLAIRLFSEIHDAFGIELPLATILRAPTIESLARVILEGGHRDQRATLVTITPTGQRPPMFCVGPMEGEVILFRKLALELGNDQPLYGLQPFAMANRLSLLSSIEEIAGHYVEQIRSSSRRAHCLLGYSLGGVVALEMAQQLRSSGEEVPLVVLIDTHYPAVCRSEESWQDCWRRYRYHLRHLASRAGFEYLAERTRIRSLRILRKVASVARTAPIAAPDVLHAQWLAGEAYRAKPYAGRVCLFRAESRSEFLHGGPSLGWNGVLSDLTIEEIPGDHGTIYTGNNLQLLARFLEGQLESCFADAAR